MLERIWANLAGRIGGPLTLRLVVQPVVAAWFALRAGQQDAQQGRAPYGFELIREAQNRKYLLREGWRDIAKVFVAAVAMDLIYQVLELPRLYPEEALIVAVTLALVPYVLIRGLANRATRHQTGQSNA